MRKKRDGAPSRQRSLEREVSRLWDVVHRLESELAALRIDADRRPRVVVARNPARELGAIVRALVDR